jgi:hypothetical protein
MTKFGNLHWLRRSFCGSTIGLAHVPHVLALLIGVARDDPATRQTPYACRNCRFLDGVAGILMTAGDAVLVGLNRRFRRDIHRKWQSAANLDHSNLSCFNTANDRK